MSSGMACNLGQKLAQLLDRHSDRAVRGRFEEVFDPPGRSAQLGLEQLPALVGEGRPTGLTHVAHDIKKLGATPPDARFDSFHSSWRAGPLELQPRQNRRELPEEAIAAGFPPRVRDLGVLLPLDCRATREKRRPSPPGLRRYAAGLDRAASRRGTPGTPRPARPGHPATGRSPLRRPTPTPSGSHPEHRSAATSRRTGRT